MNRIPGLVKRTRQYAIMGMTMGGMLCALPLLSYLLAGSRGFDELHTSLPQVLAVYTLGGCIAGGLVGVVLPVIRSDVVAALIGCIIGIMGGFAIQFMDTSRQGWTFNEIAVPITAGIMLGGPLGVVFRRTPSDSERSGKRKDQGQVMPRAHREGARRKT